MNKNVPLLGAMHIVGKDRNSHKVILPTYYHTNIIRTVLTNKRISFLVGLKKLFNKLKPKSIRKKVNHVKFVAKKANEIRADYMLDVTFRISEMQALAKKSKRASTGFNN